MRDDHNMWNYIYYSLYLDYTDHDEHTAVEKYVFEEVMFVLRNPACIGGSLYAIYCDIIFMMIHISIAKQQGVPVCIFYVTLIKI